MLVIGRALVLFVDGSFLMPRIALQFHGTILKCNGLYHT